MKSYNKYRRNIDLLYNYIQKIDVMIINDCIETTAFANPHHKRKIFDQADKIAYENNQKECHSPQPALSTSVSSYFIHYK